MSNIDNTSIDKKIRLSIQQKGVAFTYRNSDGTILLLDPDRVNMYSCGYILAQEGSGRILSTHGIEQIVFPNKMEAQGALKVLKRYEPFKNYKIVKLYNHNNVDRKNQDQSKK